MEISTTHSSDILRSFTLWAIEQLKLEVSQIDDVYRLRVPPDQRNAWEGREQLAFTFNSIDGNPIEADKASSTVAELVTASGRLFNWLVGRLSTESRLDANGAVHARPLHQPISVHEFSEGIFSAYRVERGNLHLGGCTLEDRPLVRLTYRADTAEGEQLWHMFFRPDGEALADDTVAALQLDELIPYANHSKNVCSADIETPMAAGAKLAQQKLANQPVIDGPKCVAVTIAWCKYAEGKLRFTIGDSVAELPFSGWAQTLQAPPFVCPLTSATGFHLDATDNGQITVQEQIAVCAESARRVLAHELVQCSVTGQRILPDYAKTCSVTGLPTLPSSMVLCSECQQRVSRAAIDAEVCQGCRSLVTVKKDDPRIARLLGEYPNLDRWVRWKLSETATAYVTRATGFWYQLLLVLDKDSLEPQYLASNNRFSSRWVPLKSDEYDAVLR